jgi:hypothetical protein
MMAVMTRADIDRAARQAYMKKTEPEVDLLEDGFPFEPAFWNIVVEPIKARTVSDGGIEVPDVATQADGIQLTVCRALKCGPTAFEGKTVSGIALKDFLPGIDCAEKLVGRYFIHQLHTGQELTLRKTGKTIRVLKLTDLLGETGDPNAWKFYV